MLKIKTLNYNYKSQPCLRFTFPFFFFLVEKQDLPLLSPKGKKKKKKIPSYTTYTKILNSKIVHIYIFFKFLIKITRVFK